MASISGGHVRNDNGFPVKKAIIVLFLLSFKVFISMNTPIKLYYHAGHDDGLFMSHAVSILRGDWLGAFSQFTLMKGPGYPLFVALAAASGLPLSLCTALFQFLAIGVTSLAIARITRRDACGWVTLILLVLLSVCVDPSVSRVIRDEIYWGQTILFFSLSAIAFLDLKISAKSRIWIALSAGLILGWAWLTREEGVWFIPGFVVTVLGGLIVFWRNRSPLRLTIYPLTVVIAGFAAVHIAFMTLNFITYGSFANVDFNETNFKAALRALQSIDDGDRIEYVPINAAARDMAAKYSPTFAPLADALKPGGSLSGWTHPGCSVYPQTCGDYAGGWFAWAFRDAAALSGFYKSPAIAKQKFGQIASEINKACATGDLPCRSGLFSYVPPITSTQWMRLPIKAWEVLRLISLTDYSTLSRPAPNPEVKAGHVFDMYWMFLNYPKVVAPYYSETPLVIYGWFYSRSHLWPEIVVLDQNLNRLTTSIERLPSPDIIAHFNDPKAINTRFQIRANCPDKCVLSANIENGNSLSIPLDSMQDSSSSSGDATLWIDAIGNSSHATAIPDPRQDLARETSNIFIKIYNYLFPALIMSGIIAFCMSLFLLHKRRSIDVTMVLAASAYIFVATRISIQTIIDTTMFPAINILYSQPSFYIILLSSILSISSLINNYEKQI